MEAGSAAPGGIAWRLWALVPIVLLALAVALVVSQGDRVVDLVGGTPPPADEFDIRRVEFRAGRDPDPGAQPAARRPDDRARDRRRRDRAVLGRRADDARPAPVEHDRRSVRLGRGGADRSRRHELDGHPDHARGTGRGPDAAAERARLPRLRADRPARRRRPGRARAALAPRPAAGRQAVARRLHGAHRAAS